MSLLHHQPLFLFLFRYSSLSMFETCLIIDLIIDVLNVFCAVLFVLFILGTGIAN